MDYIHARNSRVQCCGSSEPSGQSRRPSQNFTDGTHRTAAAAAASVGELQANSDSEHAAAAVGRPSAASAAAIAVATTMARNAVTVTAAIGRGGATADIAEPARTDGQLRYAPYDRRRRRTCAVKGLRTTTAAAANVRGTTSCRHATRPRCGETESAGGAGNVHRGIALRRRAAYEGATRTLPVAADPFFRPPPSRNTGGTINTAP